MGNLMHIHHHAPIDKNYKVEPKLDNIDGIIEECHATANKFKVEPLGELPCPVPPEVE